MSSPSNSAAYVLSHMKYYCSPPTPCCCDYCFLHRKVNFLINDDYIKHLLALDLKTFLDMWDVHIADWLAEPITNIKCINIP